MEDTVTVLKFQTLYSVLFFGAWILLFMQVFLKILSEMANRSSLIWVCTVYKCHFVRKLRYKILGHLPYNGSICYLRVTTCSTIIAPDKNSTRYTFFLISPKNRSCYWYHLEVLQWGATNEYPWRKWKKKKKNLDIPLIWRYKCM